MSSNDASYTWEMYDEYVAWLAEEYPSFLPMAFGGWVAWNKAMDAIGVRHDIQWPAALAWRAWPRSESGSNDP